MDLDKRIRGFAELGDKIRNCLSENPTGCSGIIDMINNIHITDNEWFTPDNIRFALKSAAEMLTNNNLSEWCSKYPSLKTKNEPVTVGVVMAGNIPLVGFHDFLSVLITGNRIKAKTSSKDSKLIRLIADMLCSAEPGFSEYITFTDGTIKESDMIIATGSDNTSRYFEYYFGRYPHIFRQNRNSIAILDGSETREELIDLGTDVFSYFGMGCRNVSKLYVPVGYEIKKVTDNWDRFTELMYHNKYVNNYDYNKAIFIINKEKFLDTGFLLLKEETGLSSPVAVLYYEFYDSAETLNGRTGLISDKIQAIVGRNHVPFGKAQSPRLWDYADGFDTIEFLLKKK